MRCTPCTFVLPLMLGGMVASNIGLMWGLMAGGLALALNLGLARITGRAACPSFDRPAAAQEQHPALAQPMVQTGIRVPSGEPRT